MRASVLARFLLLGAVVCLAVLPMAHRAGAPAPAASATRLSAYDGAARALLAKMSLDEKIGQMTQADQQFLKDARDIETCYLGSLLNGGDSDPKTNSLQDWTDMYDRYQSQTLKTRLAIPLLYGVDAVHGHSNVLGAVIFPHNIGLGCTRNPRLVEQAVRIDDAVMRILRVKLALGLMDKSRSPLADRRLHQAFGSPDHRRVARECVRQSLVLLKNQNRVLPLSKKAARIHVAGKSADNIGNQCGGWTIAWQGKSGEVTIGGATIFQAIRAAATKGASVTYSIDGSGAAGADVGIAVIGEKPYAEMFGDAADLRLAKEDVEAVTNMKRAGIPVVVVLLSGRPLVIDQVLDQVEGFIAAWLPGTEGQGVADVLFGDYKPTGKLSFTWPRSVERLRADPLFKYGYGLSY
jgi:hypothetical protein